jgi:hypothetical protein
LAAVIGNFSWDYATAGFESKWTLTVIGDLLANLARLESK